MNIRHFRSACRLLIGQLVMFLVYPLGATAAVTWICSTAEHPWQQMPAPPLRAGSVDAVPQVQVEPGTTRQTIDGFGGCFNELGWVALAKASTSDRQKVLSSLFADNGCAFTLGRIPIGASDYALDGYSLDDVPSDLELKRFSIERDEKHLIPYIKAAMAVRPSLKCWSSPWSPPAWMKTNNSYSNGSIKSEPAILQAYATYFVSWIEAYRGAGISIYALTPQNEPNITNVYPTCLWTGTQLREFITDYLGPVLRNRKANVELWLGINGDPPHGGNNPNDRLAAVLGDPKANAFLTGAAFQYDSKNQIRTAHELYPDKKLMQSETDCRSGANSWADAQQLYAQMKRYFDGGANAYFLWNMVLDETGLSTWKWRQNAPITVNHTTGRVTYNGEYYVMRHFSQYVKPGAKLVDSTGTWGDKIAFVNPDGSTVIVVGNSSRQPEPFRLQVAEQPTGGIVEVTLPMQSINTFVIGTKTSP